MLLSNNNNGDDDEFAQWYFWINKHTVCSKIFQQKEPT